ncbi:hypothetical protein Nepgr_008255 [Nepenthes gracilis]|uniref:Cyclin-dependent kinase inhibitor domain-containing protein n=1 Tax=Nepenthes gracilis TaxID=150966 RepID=A0AAD3S8P9_NEPGR|nr:hypothetical protein Nepgr_008255 [Nepenthes gracilis]
MRRYLRKCKRVGKIARVGVAELGDRERTRVRTLAMAVARSPPAVGKRIRNVQNGEVEFTSTYVELRSRRRVLIATKDSISPAVSASCVEETICYSGTSDNMPPSCCSSNSPTELVKEPFASIDPEEESSEPQMSMHSDCRKRRETTPSSEFQAELEDLEYSMVRPREANSRLNSTTVQKIPLEFEIEEFFAAAEKNLHKRFTEKYNFDVVKDVPLDGRYEWVPVKPPKI